MGPLTEAYIARRLGARGATQQGTPDERRVDSRDGAVVWHRPRPLAIRPRYLSITSIDRMSSKAIHFFTMRNRRSNVTTSDTAPQVVTYPSRS